MTTNKDTMTVAKASDNLPIVIVVLLIICDMQLEYVI